MEREANEYASEVLMPEELVRAAWPAIMSLRWMATAFGVSVKAMDIRLRGLGLHEHGYMMAFGGGQNADVPGK
jgi:Zn-dependent peptidase ImmA (M78 family)